jgi:hypothetical protein
VATPFHSFVDGLKTSMYGLKINILSSMHKILLRNLELNFGKYCPCELNPWGQSYNNSPP